MPSNSDFSFKILIGQSTVLPEYEHNGEIYVESNLFTPYSYKQNSQQMVNGEVEKQNWPVTPFMISVESGPNTPSCYYRINIDGQKVKGISVGPCEKRLVKGFRDGTSVREFLFSLPRFASDEDDRIDISCRNRIGTVEVECYNARQRQTRKRLHTMSLEFEQANKKDSTAVTKGKYLMATTKAGRVISNREAYKMTDFWDIESLRSKLSVKYVTAQTLQEMGLSVMPIPFPVSSQSSSQGSDCGIKVKSEMVPGNMTVVLDLTHDMPSCFYRQNIKSEVELVTDIDLDHSNVDLTTDSQNGRPRPSKRIRLLPPEMNNSTIDLTEEENIESNSVSGNKDSDITMDDSGISVSGKEPVAGVSVEGVTDDTNITGVSNDDTGVGESTKFDTVVSTDDPGFTDSGVSETNTGGTSDDKDVKCDDVGETNGLTSVDNDDVCVASSDVSETNTGVSSDQHDSGNAGVSSDAADANTSVTDSNSGDTTDNTGVTGDTVTETNTGVISDHHDTGKTGVSGDDTNTSVTQSDNGVTTDNKGDTVTEINTGVDITMNEELEKTKSLQSNTETDKNRHSS